MDGCAGANSLVRVDTSVGVFSFEKLLDDLPDFGDSGGSSDEHDFIDLVLLQTTIVQSSLHGFDGAPEQVGVEFFKLSSGEDFLEVESFNEVFDFNGDFVGGRKLPLCLFNIPSEFLDGSSVSGNILIVLLLDVLDEVVNNSLVEVLSSKMGIS